VDYYCPGNLVRFDLWNNGHVVEPPDEPGIGDMDGSNDTDRGINTTPGGYHFLEVLPSERNEGGVSVGFDFPVAGVGFYVMGLELEKRDVQFIIHLANGSYVDGSSELIKGPRNDGGVQFLGYHVTDLSDKGCYIKGFDLFEPYNAEPASKRDIYALDDIIYTLGQDSSGDCVEFEDLILSDTYEVGDTFNVANADNSLSFEVHAKDFTYADGSTTADGIAKVEDGGLAGHNGLELSLDNILLEFVPTSHTPMGLSLLFGEYGGNVNLSINGTLKKAANFSDLDGQVIGGVHVMVPWGGHGNDNGELILGGAPIYSFSIGGQELWIDHLCEMIEAPDGINEDAAQCYDFNNLASVLHPIGDIFSDQEDNPSFQFEVVGYEDQTSYTNTAGNAFIVGGASNDVADGKAVQLNSAGIRIMPQVSGSRPQLPNGISFLYRDDLVAASPGKVKDAYLAINGDGLLLESFSDFNGVQLGGASIEVIPGDANHPAGEVLIYGVGLAEVTVASWHMELDHLCTVTKTGGIYIPSDNFTTVDFELLENKLYSQGQGFTADGSDPLFKFKVVTFKDAKDYENPLGNVYIVPGQANQADQGNALEINAAGLAIKPVLTTSRPNPPLGIFLHYRDDIVPDTAAYPNDVYLSVNGEGILGKDLVDFNGAQLGGAMIHVKEPDTSDSVGRLEITGKPLEELVIAGFHLQVDHFGILETLGGDSSGTNTGGEGQLGTANPTCIEFETLNLGASYFVGDAFQEGYQGNGQPIMDFVVGPFTDSQGQTISNGQVDVETGNIPAHGNELSVMDATLTMKPIIPVGGSAPTIIGMIAKEKGEKIEVSINGSAPIAAADLIDLDGTNLSGVTIKIFPVPQTGSGNVPGHDGIATGLVLEGKITSLSLGAVILDLDQICPGYAEDNNIQPDASSKACVEFESLALDDTYAIHTNFTADDPYASIDFQVVPFTNSAGEEVSDGGLTVVTEEIVHLGNEIYLKQAGVLMTPLVVAGSVTPTSMSIVAREDGENVSISVNGDAAMVGSNFGDLDGQTIGGVTFKVYDIVQTPSGSTAGDDDVPTGLRFEADTVGIKSVEIGGSSVYLDHICMQYDTMETGGETEPGNISEADKYGGDQLVLDAAAIYPVDVTGMVGEEIMVPFKVKHFDQIGGIQLAVNWDSSVLELATFSLNGTTLPKATSIKVSDGNGGETSLISIDNFQISEAGDKLQLLWSDKQAIGVTIDDDEILFSLMFKIVGSPGSQGMVGIGTSTAEIPPYKLVPISGAEIQETTQAAMVTVGNELSVGGTILLAGDANKPMSGVKVVMEQSGSQVDTLSDDLGQYEFALTPDGGNVYLSADRDNANLGVDVGDILVLRKHILNRELLTSPIALIASDPNRDGSTDVADIVEMRKVILRRTDNYSKDAQGNPQSVWRFLDANFLDVSVDQAYAKVSQYEVLTLNGLTSDVSDADFIGIKLGDANLDWAPPAGNTTQSNRAGLIEEGLVRLSPAAISSDGDVFMDVYADSIEGLMGIQFGLEWDPSVLRLRTIHSLQLPGFSLGRHASSTPDSAMVAWDDAQLLGIRHQPDEPILRLVFAPLAGATRGSAIGLNQPMLFGVEGSQKAIMGVGSYYHPEANARLTTPGLIQTMHHQEGVLRLEVVTEVGRSYLVEMSHDLSPDSWEVVATFEGSGFSQSVEVSTREESQAYIRVQEVTGTIQ